MAGPGAVLQRVVAIPNAEGNTEWWELTDTWRLLRTELGLSEVSGMIDSHTALPNAHHPANVGVTGSKVVGNFRLTFTNGLLTGFEPV